MTNDKPIANHPKLAQADFTRAQELDIFVLAGSIIKEFEGFRENQYADLGDKLTIGYGHKLLKGEKFGTMTRTMGENVLNGDMAIACDSMLYRIDKKALQRLEVHQMAALVSLVFNIGQGNFRDSSMLMRINHLDFDGALGWFKWWRQVGNDVVDGLVRRRACEALLWRDGVVDFEAWDTHKEFVA